MRAEPPPPEPPEPDAGGIDRRTLLGAGLSAGAAATIAGLWFEGFGNARRRQGVTPTAGAPGRTFTAAEWSALEAAYDRILPSGPGSPGAREVNAVGYLDAVLTGPELDPVFTLDVVRAGVPRLAEAARRAGAASFAALAGDAQDAVLQGFEKDAAGKAWLRKMVYFGLEALLGDPVHGCQPGEVGWKWLGITVAAPRPSQPGWKPIPR